MKEPQETTESKLLDFEAPVIKIGVDLEVASSAGKEEKDAFDSEPMGETPGATERPKPSARDSSKSVQSRKRRKSREPS